MNPIYWYMCMNMIQARVALPVAVAMGITISIPAHSRPSDEIIEVDPSRFPPGLEITTRVNRVDLRETWQTGPYCGANSLYVLLALKGRDVAYSTLKSEVPTTARGANLVDLKVAAGRHGQVLEVYKTTPGELAALGKPLIALLGLGKGPEINGHFVVVCGENESHIDAIDGTTGNLDVIAKPAFAREFSGYVLAEPDSGPPAATRPWLDFLFTGGCVFNALMLGGAGFRWLARSSRGDPKDMP
ncbi:MAG: cysteine peptidase family C39 domain-containing protein [Isosphaeraceae bacterium]